MLNVWGGGGVEVGGRDKAAATMITLGTSFTLDSPPKPN